MKRFFYLFLFLLTFALAVFAELPFSQLPLTTDPNTVGIQDSFPYVQRNITNSTRRLYLKDIVGIPAFTNKFATLATLESPIFTGTVTAPIFSGELVGNATNVTGVVQLDHGGTGASTRDVALSNLLPSQSGLNSYQVLSSVGGSATWVSGVISVNGKYGNATITKTEIGLGNVDNTSDGDKNAAAATLENKTILSPVISNPSITGGLTFASTFNNGYVSNTAIYGGSVSATEMYNSFIYGGIASGVTSYNPNINGGSISSSTAIHAASIVSGTLPIVRGGTNNGALVVSAGAVVYADGTKLVSTGAGVSGTVLQSQGASGPTFVSKYIVQALTGTVINWDQANAFTRTLTGNTTYTFAGAQAGQTIVIRLTNTVANYTVSWPAILWSNSTTPVMTTGAKSDVYTIFFDGTTYYGAYSQNH